MGCVSFAGRVLFSAIFILAAWQKLNDLGHSGGSNALKHLEPKFELVKHHIKSTFHLEIPEFELKYLLMAGIAAEGIGGILFIFGSTLGAYLLLLFLAVVTPVMHDFYNYDLSNPNYVREFMEFLKNMSLVGALLFYLGMVQSQRLKKRATKVKST